MPSSLFLVRSLSLGCALMFSQAIFATTGAELSSAEADTIAKEDIASAQVMLENCPTLIGSDKLIQEKVLGFINESVADLSDTSMTYAKLQGDTEYQNVLKQARDDMKQASAAEQKEVCQDILTM